MRRGARPGGGRMVELDVMRGAAIIAVVYLHAWFSPWEVTPHRQVLVIHVLHLFAHTAVPLFLFMAGFLQARDRSPGFRAFQRRKLGRIYVPMLFWMTAALLYRAWQEGWSNELARSFVLFDTAGQFYYLFVLTLFFAAFFFVRGWSAARLGWLAAAAFAVNLGAVAFYEHGRDLSGDYAVLAYRNPAVWVFFFAAGFWVSRQWGTPSHPAWAGAGAAVMTIAGVAQIVRGEWGPGYPASYFGVTQFLFSAGAVLALPAAARLLLARRAGSVVARPLTWLGPYAFGIYLVHIPFFVGFVTTRLVSDSPVQDDYWKLMHGIFAIGFLTALEFVLLVTWLAPRTAAALLGVEVKDGAPWVRLPRPPRLALPAGGKAS